MLTFIVVVLKMNAICFQKYNKCKEGLIFIKKVIINSLQKI